jgi:hypothetical protein
MEHSEIRDNALQSIPDVATLIRATEILQLAFVYLRHLEQMPQQSRLQRLVAMDRDRQPMLPALP